ncbi:hypothetical protein BD769DRAFT_1661072 [Suillus cothurnatus]|nr:hypothetical protein BD769DRAFT_1661072 [Suillus cothurnatus]
MYQLNTLDITTISITIVGAKNLPVKSLPSLLSVNCNRVKDTLLFLKKENHLYSDIIILEDNLCLLSEDSLPPELFTIIKHSDQCELLEQEQEEYIIEDDDNEEYDTYDPITPVLAGQDINLDDFDHHSGPDASHCAIIVANDPYAAANFFHFIICAIIKELMSITVPKSKKGSISCQEGIFGIVEGYIDTVEAQG